MNDLQLHLSIVSRPPENYNREVEAKGHRDLRTECSVQSHQTEPSARHRNPLDIIPDRRLTVLRFLCEYLQ